MFRQKEFEEYVKECNYGRLREKWKAQVGDFCVIKGEHDAVLSILKGSAQKGILDFIDGRQASPTQVIWLPTLEQMTDLLGEHFHDIFRHDASHWDVKISPDLDKIEYFVGRGESLRLAMVRALKKIL